MTDVARFGSSTPRARLRDLAPFLTGLAGTSFKHEHFQAILNQGRREAFFEVHAENYMGGGGPPHRMLARIRADYPLSLHGVCMSIGGPEPLDPAHLERFRSLVLRYEPALVSEHLAWSAHNGTYFNDLLPLPYTAATLACVAEHVDQVQNTIGRTILLENPATYIAFAETTMAETDFLRALAHRSGCGLLLDINNVFVSATNQGYSPTAYLAEFPLDCVGEIHLAGHAEQTDDEGDLLLIDSHDQKVAAPVWRLFEDVIEHCGPIPTIVEWDSSLPEWPVLRAEAAAAQAILDRGAPSVPRHTLMPADNFAPIDGAPSSSYAAILAPGLLDPAYATPAGLVGPRGERAVKRYNVYRNNVTVSLIDALAAIFPATQRITGIEFFRAMARFHVRSTPPRSPLLFDYGHDFPDFIARYEYAQAMPYLPDTARIERAWLDAYHSADVLPLPAQALAGVPPSLLADVAFVAHPATRIVRSSVSAVTIFAANRQDAPVERIEASVPEDALITRPDQEVTVRRLPPGGAEFLAQLLSGRLLGDAATAAFDAAPDFDLATNVAGMIEAGVFTALHVGDHP